MHLHGIGALDKIGLPPAALEEALNFLVGDAGKYRGVADLKAVEVEDRQNRAIACGIQKLVAVPSGCQRAGFRLAVTHHAGRNQVRIVEHGAKGMGQGIAQLAAFIDGTGGLRGNVAGNATGEGELLEQPLHTLNVPADVGVNLTVGALQICLSHHGIAAVTGAGEVDHVQVVLFNDAVEVGIDEVLTGNRAPVAHDLPLDMLRLQRLP